MSEPGVCVMYPDIPFDELDAEDLEDIEVSLYGMLHHAPSDETFNGPQLDLTDDYKDQNSVRLPTAETSDTPPPSEPAKKHLKDKTRTKQLNHASKSLKKESKHLKNKPTSISGPRKNPYSEYLIVEKSDHSRRVSEIITLSDEEDSRYQSIAKSSTTFSSKKRVISPLANLPTPDESDSDESIVVLDENEPTKFVTLKPRIDHHVTQSSDSSSSSSSEDSEVELIDSSDSSSPIDTSGIQLNVSGTSESRNLADIVRTGSQTFNWKSYSSSKWTPEMIEFYNRGGDGVDLDAVYQSLPRNVKWTVDAEDLYGGQKNRYFGGKRSRIRCANCNQWDHVTKNCRMPKKEAGCNICGLPGHRSFGCPSKCCLGCGRPSKILIECCPECRRERNAVCMICRFNHFTKNCPDLWRRYHSTTTQQDEPIAPSDQSSRPKGPLYCSNCTRRGHLAVDCREYRWSKFPAVSPAVFSYEDPLAFLENVTANNEKNATVNISNNGKSVWVVEPPTTPGRMRDLARSPNKGAPKTNFLRLSADGAPPDGTFRSVKQQVLAEIKNVEITWRNQVKKRRVLVEFTGHGNTMEAKNKFKKMIHFKMDKKKAENSSPRKVQSAESSTTVNEESPAGRKPTKREKALKKEPKITSVSIVQLNTESKEMRRTVRCQLIEKEKKNLGSLLSRMETKHKVRITSSMSDKTWEIVINNLTQGKSSSAFYAIIRYLDAASARPAGL